MANLSDIHLSILPASSLGLVQAEVAFDAGFTKQELAQKQAYTLSIGLFGTWDSSGNPSPEPLGSFFADRSRGYSDQHRSPMPQRPQPMGFLPGGPNWNGGAWNGMPGYLPGYPPNYPQGNNYGEPGYGYPQQYPYGQAYGHPSQMHPQHRPYPQGYGMQRHPQQGYGNYGQGYAPGYGQQPYWGNGNNGFGQYGFEPQYQQPAYAHQTQGQSQAHANGNGNGNGSGHVNGQTNGHSNGQNRNQQQQRQQQAQANAQAATAEAPEAEVQVAQPRLSAPEYFITWVGRELLVPTLPQLNLQRRCLFDPRETPFPFFRAYVWLIPDRMDGRGWSLPSANPLMVPYAGQHHVEY